MRKEKTPDVTQGSTKLGASKKHGITLGDSRGKCNSLKLFSGGAILKVEPITRPQSSQMKGGAKRGKVAGLTSASRRRLRIRLMTFRPKAHLLCVGATLTIPGPSMGAKRSNDLFGSFSREYERADACANWRKEIQKRGMLHWHLMAGVPSYDLIPLLWMDLIHDMGPEKFDVPHLLGEGSRWPHLPIISCSSRMVLPGAVQHCCNVQRDGDNGSWLRYLQDHTSKAKQEQIPDDAGRHWGVIGRKLFDPVFPSEDYDLTDTEYRLYLRYHQRLATPSEKNACPFGRRLRGRITRGNRGESVWFGLCETHKRIASFAIGRHVAASSFLEYSRRRASALEPVSRLLPKKQPMPFKKHYSGSFVWALPEAIISNVRTFIKSSEMVCILDVAYMGGALKVKFPASELERLTLLKGKVVSIVGEGAQGHLTLTSVN